MNAIPLLPQPSLKRNYLYNGLAILFNIAIPLVTFAYVTRVLGPTIFGKVSFAQSLVSFFVTAAGLSIPLYGAREIARVRNQTGLLNKSWTELMLINGIGTAIVSCLFLLLIPIVPKLHADWMLFLIAGGMLYFNFFSCDWLYQGFENYRYNSLRSIAFKGITTLLLFIVVKSKTDYYQYALLGVIAIAGSSLLAFARSGKHVRFSFKNLSLLPHLRPVLFLFGSAVTVSVYIYLDSVLLGFLAGDRAVGLYSAALRIDKTICLGIATIGSAMIPRISHILEKADVAEYTRLSQKSLHFVFFLALPAMTAILILAPQLVSILAGREFADSVLTTRICALLLPAIGFNTFFGMQILFPNKQEKTIFISTAGAACINLASNFMLIPLFKHNGAAISTVLAECTVIIIQILLAQKKDITFRFFDKSMGAFILSSAVMGVIVFIASACFSSPLISLSVAVPGGACVYFASLLLFKEPLFMDLLNTIRTKGLRIL